LTEVTAQAAVAVDASLIGRERTGYRYGIAREYHADQEGRTRLPLTAIALAKADGNRIAFVAILHGAA
jgi:hypothetical protein